MQNKTTKGSGMIKKIIYAGLSLIFVLVVSCTHDHEHEEAEHETYSNNSVTLFTGKTEIFMEYTQHVKGVSTDFIIHLTVLEDFSPVTEGMLEIDFLKNSQKHSSFTENRPKRDGIFLPSISFNEAGNYDMILRLSSEKVNDTIIVKNVIVYNTEADIPRGHEEESGGISFLKEQQWKIDFSTEEVSRQLMQNSLALTGELIPEKEKLIKVSAPISGMILNEQNRNLKIEGQKVRKGETLLNITPTGNSGENLYRIKNDFELAKIEFERIERLFKNGAVSKKRFDQTKYEYEAKLAEYNAVASIIKLEDNRFLLTSPIDGIISETSYTVGEKIGKGVPLFTIVNPEKLILKVNLPAKFIEKSISSNSLDFKVEGYDKNFRLEKLNGKKLSVSPEIDMRSNTIDIFFRIDNPRELLKPGMKSEVNLKIDSPRQLLAVPTEAIINEDGLKTIYVQLDGESFEKRIVKTGIENHYFTEILSGIKSGERVVVKGAYQVRLAALSPESAIGAGHVH